MNVQRMLALVLIVTQVVVFIGLWGEWTVPVLLAALACIGSLGRIRWRLSRQSGVLFVLVLALAFVIKWQLFQEDEYPTVGMVLSQARSLSPTIALYMLAIQVSLFYLEARGPMSPVLPCLGLVTLTFTGDINAPDTGHALYQGGSLVFAIAAVFYLSFSVRRVGAEIPGKRFIPRLLVVVALAVALGTGWYAATLLARHGNSIDGMLARVLSRAYTPPAVGFGQQARLGSGKWWMKDFNANQVALRILSDQPPSYLRGLVFDDYQGPAWNRPPQDEPVPLAEPVPQTLKPSPGTRNVFALDRPEPDIAGLEVWPGLQLAENVFAPLGASLVAAPVPQLLADDQGAMLAPELNPGDTYAVYAADTPQTRQPVTIDRERYTAVPADLDLRIGQLAGRLFDGRTTTGAKIAAVTGHLQQRHDYELGIEIPGDVDPLTHFLLAEPPPAAHCEYFASAAAVLLRLGGVPTRYVTGFVAAEHNPQGGYWVARNKDAHAWVEAYDDRTGWTIVEATPAAGVPSTQAGFLGQLWDAAKFGFYRVRAAIADGGLPAVAALLTIAGKWFLTNTVGRCVLALALAVIGVVLVRRFRNRKRPRKQVDPAIRVLNRLLAQMDKRLKRHGLVRRPTEPLRSFADRITNELEPTDTAAQSD